MVSILDAIRSTRSAQQARETVKSVTPKATKKAQEAVNVSFKGIFDAIPKPSDLLSTSPRAKDVTPKVKQAQKKPLIPTQSAPTSRVPQQVSPQFKAPQLPAFNLNSFISGNKTLSKLFGGS
jgi:hypothetical protein